MHPVLPVSCFSGETHVGTKLPQLPAWLVLVQSAEAQALPC